MTTTAQLTEPVQSTPIGLDGIVYLDGAFLPAGQAAVNVYDHGLLYGDGVFEGIRAYNGRVFKLARHLERLVDSAKAVRLALPKPAEDIADIVLDTCRRNAIVDGYIRLVVTRGVGTLGIDPRTCPRPSLFVIARPMKSFYGGTPRGISLVTSALRRIAPDALSPSIKSLNYMNNVLARIEANDAGADEALMLDAQGYVAEASVDNLFMMTDRGLVTPPTSTNLKGITRETVIELATSLGVPVTEAKFTLFDVWTAREVFVCGTGAEIVPVRSIDGREIGDGDVGPITTKIIDRYFSLVRSSGTPIPGGHA
jgi:branched-chain amino acid aminotransferase